MSKDYRHDPAKKAWRDAKTRFIRKHLKHGMAFPPNMHVVCFPGEDALDVELYEELGVRRGNIIGIECDRRKAAAIERKKPGVQVYRGMDHEFFGQADGKFDVIDLDYECPFGYDARVSLINISRKQLLTGRSVLFSNTLGKREDSIAKYMLLAYSMAQSITAGYGRLLRGDSNTGSLFDEEAEFGDIRSKNVTKGMIAILKDGLPDDGPNPLYARVPAETEAVNAHIVSIGLKKEMADSLGITKLLTYVMASIKVEERLEALKLNGRIHRLLKMYYSRPYLAEDIFRCYYVGSNGSPMLSDFFFLCQEREIFDRYGTIAETIFSPNEMEGLKSFLRKRVGSTPVSNTKQLKSVSKSIENCVLQRMEVDSNIINNILSKFSNLPERVFLGSSARRGHLTGDQYYQCSVQQGMTDAQIAEAYKLPERGSMAAFRAHVRMGTYGPVPDEWFESHSGDDNERNQKIEIARRIAAGEDEDLLKSKYGLKTLAGIKAAMKRGAYDEELAKKPAEVVEEKRPERGGNGSAKGSHKLEMSENARLRIKYFFDEDLAFMPEYAIEEVRDMLRKERCYRRLSHLPDMQVYGFFDDLMLAARSGKRISSHYVNSLLEQ